MPFVVLSGCLTSAMFAASMFSLIRTLPMASIRVAPRSDAEHESEAAQDADPVEDIV